MFNDRYNLTGSALTPAFPLMIGLVVWMTSFNCCRTSLLLLLSNFFLKVRALYFKVNSAISGASAGHVRAFWQLFKCFFKLIAQLMTLLQRGHLSFLMAGSQCAAWAQLGWRRIWNTSCTCVVFFLLDTPSVAQSFASPCQLAETCLRVHHRLRCCYNLLLLAWFKKKNKKNQNSFLFNC